MANKTKQWQDESEVTSLKDLDENVSGLLMGRMERPGFSCRVRGLVNSNR